MIFDPKKTPKLQDGLIGAMRSIRNGTAMSFWATNKEIRRARDERVRREGFGAGEEGFGGDNSWTPPVYATLDNGRPITISYGRGSRKGHYLVADGHIPFGIFYNTAAEQGHDHFRDGTIIADRGASS